MFKRKVNIVYAYKLYCGTCVNVRRWLNVYKMVRKSKGRWIL